MKPLISLEQWNRGTVVTGYRSCDQPAAYYVRSLLKLHNETINIYSHLCGFLLFFGLILWPATKRVRFDPFLLLYYVGAAVCFASSTLFHTFMPHSEASFHRLQGLDYAGVLMMIAASSAVAPVAYIALLWWHPCQCCCRLLC